MTQPGITFLTTLLPALYSVPYDNQSSKNTMYIEWKVHFFRILFFSALS